MSNSSSSDVAIEDRFNDNQDCDPQKIKRHSSTNKLFRFSFDESNNPQPMTHWRERERKRAAEEGDKTEKLRDREKRTYRHRRPHCSMREKRWSVYIYIYI